MTLTLSLSPGDDFIAEARENVEGMDERLNCLLSFRPGCVLSPLTRLSVKSRSDYGE